MSKTIAIIELYRHDEVLRHYCDMLSDGDYNIKVFCSKAVYENLKDSAWLARFDWHVKEDQITIPSFLKQKAATIQSCNLVFITTALNHFKAFYELSKVNKTLLLVHNAHSFLQSERFLSFQEPLFDRLRWLKLTFNRSHFYKKKLLYSLFALSFPTETILKYVKENFELPNHLKLISLPFAYFQPNEKIQQEKITITIPCTVSSELRDYHSVLNAFMRIKDELKEKIQLVLLGKPKGDGNQIIEAFKALENRNLEIITFQKFIPPSEYDNWLLFTDFLILPLKEFGQNHIYKERLGFSKISGGINDMIRFGIPALIPTHYPLDDALKKLTDSYAKSNLASTIETWINEQTYNSIRSNRNDFLENYKKANIQTMFLKEINSLFDTK